MQIIMYFREAAKKVLFLELEKQIHPKNVATKLEGDLSGHQIKKTLFSFAASLSNLDENYL